MRHPIPLSEVRFNDTIDPNGKLFWWRGEPYRAIRRHHASFTTRLFERGIVDHLVNGGWLVPTERTNYSLPGYALVLRHHRVPFDAHATEWCAPMVRDAALFLLDLESELERLGLMLQDGHTGNIMFEGVKPVFIDFCSIVPNIASPVWDAEAEFRGIFLSSLHRVSQGRLQDLRQHMPMGWHGAKWSPATESDPAGSLYGWQEPPSRLATTARRLPPPMFAFLKRQQTQFRRRSAALQADTTLVRRNRLSELRGEIRALPIPDALSAAVSSETSPGSSALAALFDRLNPTTVLVLGGGAPALARLVCAETRQIALFAETEADAEGCYAAALRLGLPILPVRPASRVSGVLSRWMLEPGTLESRYRADVLLAPDLDPLALPVPPDQALALLAHMTRCQAILDGRFEPATLGAHFSRIEVIALAPDHPDVLLCER